MQRIFGLILILTIPLIAFLLYTGRDVIFAPGIFEPKPTVIFNEKAPLRVTVVSSKEDLIRGLSGTKELPATEGMLFVFPQNDFHGIWMKNMIIPLDIMWVSEDGRIVDLEEHVRPDTYPQVFKPSEPSRFVIETNAGFTDTFNIKIGDTVKIPQNALPDNLKK
jgi:uncharacterized protein